MKESNHSYQNCIVGNFYNDEVNGIITSWKKFKSSYLGFTSKGYDDMYHFVFRYDIHKQNDGNYTLELCIMLQRKGIYSNLRISNISQSELDTEVKLWLQDRFKYLKSLWTEVN